VDQVATAIRILFHNLIGVCRVHIVDRMASGKMRLSSFSSITVQFAFELYQLVNAIVISRKLIMAPACVRKSIPKIPCISKP